MRSQRGDHHLLCIREAFHDGLEVLLGYLPPNRNIETRSSAWKGEWVADASNDLQERDLPGTRLCLRPRSRFSGGALRRYWETRGNVVSTLHPSLVLLLLSIFFSSLDHHRDILPFFQSTSLPWSTRTEVDSVLAAQRWRWVGRMSEETLQEEQHEVVQGVANY